MSDERDIVERLKRRVSDANYERARQSINASPYAKGHANGCLVACDDIADAAKEITRLRTLNAAYCKLLRDCHSTFRLIEFRGYDGDKGGCSASKADMQDMQAKIDAATDSARAKAGEKP